MSEYSRFFSIFPITCFLSFIHSFIYSVCLVTKLTLSFFVVVAVVFIWIFLLVFLVDAHTHTHSLSMFVFHSYIWYLFFFLSSFFDSFINQTINKNMLSIHRIKLFVVVVVVCYLHFLLYITIVLIFDNSFSRWLWMKLNRIHSKYIIWKFCCIDFLKNLIHKSKKFIEILQQNFLGNSCLRPHLSILTSLLDSLRFFFWNQNYCKGIYSYKWMEKKTHT